MKDEDSDFIRIRTVDSMFELQQVEGILKEAEISYSVISFRDTAFGELYKKEKGWGEVRVIQEQAEAARKLLDEKLSGLSDVPENEVESQALSSRLEEEEKKPWLTNFEWVVTLVLILYGVAIAYLLLKPYLDD